MGVVTPRTKHIWSTKLVGRKATMQDNTPITIDPIALVNELKSRHPLEVEVAMMRITVDKLLTENATLTAELAQYRDTDLPRNLVDQPASE